MYTILRLLLPVFIGLFLFPSGSIAQWSTYTAMPGTRWAHVCAEAQGQLYVLGGSTGPTWEYSPVTNAWVTRASIPTQRSYPAVASWNGRIYVLGGSVGAAWSTKNECYDPTTDSWATLADMPQARTTTAAAAVNGRIYVLNGWNGTAMSAVDVYDIATNTWTTAAAAPTGRSHAKTAVVNNRIYLIGGYAGGWTNINEVFDPATNTWQTLAPMPTARYIHAMDALGPQVFVAGGYSGSATNVFQSYDVATNAWTTEAAMPTARYRTDGATVDGCFYVLGGFNGSNLDVNEGFCRTILPTLLALQGWVSEGSVALSWAAQGTEQVLRYEIERSGFDGLFEQIGQLDGKAFPSGEFRFRDSSPSPEKRLYRLVQVWQDGSRGHSAAIELGPELSRSLSLGYDRKLNQLALVCNADLLTGNAQLRLFDLQGHLLEFFAFDAGSLAAGKRVFPLSRQYKGLFLVRIQSRNGQVHLRKLIL